jgi:hypothetical protein
MIGSVGSQNQMYAMQQAYQAQAAAAVAVDPFEEASNTGASSSSASAQNAANSTSAGGAGVNLLSSSTLASLLGLQTVNGQAQGGASGAQLGLPQISQPSDVDPNSLLSAQTLQMLQSIGS